MEILEILVDIRMKRSDKRNPCFSGNSYPFIAEGKFCYDMNQIRFKFQNFFPDQIMIKKRQRQSAVWGKWNLYPLKTQYILFRSLF